MRKQIFIGLLANTRPSEIPSQASSPSAPNQIQLQSISEPAKTTRHMKPLVMLGIMFVTGCATKTPVDEAFRLNLVRKVDLIQQLSTVKPSDGISKSEASIIAMNFSGRFIACGGSLEKITEEQDYWVAHIPYGILGTTDSSTRISKKDGTITTRIGPSRPRIVDSKIVTDVESIIELSDLWN